MRISGEYFDIVFFLFFFFLFLERAKRTVEKEDVEEENILCSLLFFVFSCGKGG